VSPIIRVRTDLAVLPELWSVSICLEHGPPRHHHPFSTAKKKRQQLSAVKPFVRCQLHSRASYPVWRSFRSPVKVSPPHVELSVTGGNPVVVAAVTPEIMPAMIRPSEPPWCQKYSTAKQMHQITRSMKTMSNS
jgi:hypothetical protein